MKNIVVIFGGKSVEHDISIITGLQVVKNLNNKHNVIAVYIARDGCFWTGEKLKKTKTFINFDTSNLNRCYFVPHSKKLYINKFFKDKKINVDNVILALHGANGEDGTIQGLLELCEIPYTSAGVMGSALTMDKVMCKNILCAGGIKTPQFISFYASDWEINPKSILKEIKQKFENSVFIKPARAGSSIGVSKCSSVEEIETAINVAKCFDFKIIAEEVVSNFKEVNIACVGLENNVELSCLEEIRGAGNVLDFEKKYIKSGSVQRIVDVKLKKEIKEKIESMAKKAFTLCECMGVVRMDFFVCEDKVLLNEINSIPGSMANYLWKGLSFEMLLEKLLDLSEIRQKQKNKLTYLYKSQAIVNFESKNGKMNK